MYLYTFKFDKVNPMLHSMFYLAKESPFLVRGHGFYCNEVAEGGIATFQFNLFDLFEKGPS